MAAGKALRIAGFVAAALMATACGRGAGDDAPPERGDQAAAKVDGKTIWTSDVKREAVAQRLIGAGEPLDPASDLFRQMTDEVVDQKLLAAEAARRKLDKDPAAQRRLAAARDRVLGDILVERAVADAVTENNIRSLYDEQRKLARRSQEIRARQLVVATPAEADQVRKLLATGASFEALAMERSRDAATRFNGGDLGYFTVDVMPEAYATALKGARVGQLVGPFPVAGGVALLKVEDIREERPTPLESARPQIVRFLTYDRIRDLLERLRAKARIETLIKTGAAASRAAPPPASASRTAPVTPQTEGASK